MGQLWSKADRNDGIGALQQRRWKIWAIVSYIFRSFKFYIQTLLSYGGSISMWLVEWRGTQKIYWIPNNYATSRKIVLPLPPVFAQNGGPTLSWGIMEWIQVKTVELVSFFSCLLRRRLISCTVRRLSSSPLRSKKAENNLWSKTMEMFQE